MIEFPPPTLSPEEFELLVKRLLDAESGGLLERDVWGTGQMSLFRFALYFLPENLRPPPNSKVCARDAHSNLVFLHLPRLSDLSLFSLCPSSL